jgi:hypothetical protein
MFTERSGQVRRLPSHIATLPLESQPSRCVTPSCASRDLSKCTAKCLVLVMLVTDVIWCETCHSLQHEHAAIARCNGSQHQSARSTAPDAQQRPASTAGGTCTNRRSWALLGQRYASRPSGDSSLSTCASCDALPAICACERPARGRCSQDPASHIACGQCHRSSSSRTSTWQRTAGSGRACCLLRAAG